MNRRALAVTSADWHLSDTPPIYRSADPQWYRTMGQAITQVRELAQQYSSVPVLIAGDVFHHWDAPARLINWAHSAMPALTYAIPGQHDLPHHNYRELNKSAFTTLGLSGGIIPLNTQPKGVPLPGFVLHPFSYGTPVAPYKGDHKELHVAMIHAFLDGPHSYRSESMINNRILGYDVIISGDNHLPFGNRCLETYVFNCGALMRRTRADVHFKPGVGLLWSDGTVERVELDVSADVYLEIQTPTEATPISAADLRPFIHELRKLGRKGADLKTAYEQYIRNNEVAEPIRKIIEEALEN